MIPSKINRSKQNHRRTLHRPVFPSCTFCVLQLISLDLHDPNKKASKGKQQDSFRGLSITHSLVHMCNVDVSLFRRIFLQRRCYAISVR